MTRFCLLPLLLVCVLLTGVRPARAQELLGPVRQAPEIPLVVGVELHGLGNYSERAVLSALGIEIGQPLRELQVREAFENFGIIVSEPPRILQGDGGVVLDITLQELEVDPDVRFIGVEEFSVEKVREWAGLGNARGSTSTRRIASRTASSGATPSRGSCSARWVGSRGNRNPARWCAT
ncbi:MAG: hypothetical protein R3F17_16180 [Planctomycetota bacterium]